MRLQLGGQTFSLRFRLVANNTRDRQSKSISLQLPAKTSVLHIKILQNILVTSCGIPITCPSTRRLWYWNTSSVSVILQPSLHAPTKPMHSTTCTSQKHDYKLWPTQENPNPPKKGFGQNIFTPKSSCFFGRIKPHLDNFKLFFHLPCVGESSILIHMKPW